MEKQLPLITPHGFQMAEGEGSPDARYVTVSEAKHLVPRLSLPAIALNAVNLCSLCSPRRPIDSRAA